jgi:hypothetical protein
MQENQKGNPPRNEPPVVVHQEWLEWMMLERDQVIARLRYLDRVLIRHGRLRQETLERRVR